MKKYMLALAAATLSSAAAFADTADVVAEPVDTVLHVKNVNTVVITESASGVSVEVKGIGDDDAFQTTCDIPYEKDGVIKTHQSFSMPLSLVLSRSQDILGMFQGLHFGFTGAIDAPAEMNTQMGKSFEIGVDNLIYYGHRFGASGRNMVQVGVGINWRNYRMTGKNRFDMDGDNVLVTSYPEDAEGKFSRIKVFSLTFPIAYSYRTPVKALGKSNLGFKLSAMLNWNSHASMLTQYVLADGSKVKEKYDRIGQRKFSVDIQLGVQVAPAVCLYVKYTPFNLFKSGTTSPKFQTISTGVSLGF